MKIDMGGGIFPRGEGFLNVDQTPNSDIHHNLDEFPWPLDDESVDEFYSCHCLEHLKDPNQVLPEIARICKVDARVEIRVPTPSSDMMFTAGHLHCFSPMQAVNMDRHFPHLHWKGKRRLKLLSIEYHPTELLDEFKAEMPKYLSDLPDHLIMKWFPRTSHECRFFYQVTENEFYNVPDTE